MGFFKRLFELKPPSTFDIKISELRKERAKKYANLEAFGHLEGQAPYDKECPMYYKHVAAIGNYITIDTEDHTGVIKCRQERCAWFQIKDYSCRINHNTTEEYFKEWLKDQPKGFCRAHRN